MQHSVIVKCTSFHVVASSDWPKSSKDNLVRFILLCCYRIVFTYGYVYLIFVYFERFCLERAVCKKFDKANSDRIKITVKHSLVIIT